MKMTKIVTKKMFRIRITSFILVPAIRNLTKIQKMSTDDFTAGHITTK